MNNIKRSLALVLAALMLLSLAGCGTMSMRAANAAAQLATQNGALLDVSLDADLRLGAAGQSFSFSAAAAGDVEYTRDPSAGRIDLDLSALGMSGNVLAFWQKNDDGSTELYISKDGGESWTRRTLEAKEKKTELSFSDLFGALLGGIQSFTEVSRDEEVNGRSATRYDGTLDRELLGAMLELAGVAAQNDEGSEEGGVLSVIGDLPVSIWLDNSSDRLLRVELDLTGAFGTLFALSKDKLASSFPAGQTIDAEAERVVLNIIFSERVDDGAIVMPSVEAEEAAQTDEEAGIADEEDEEAVEEAVEEAEESAGDGAAEESAEDGAED